MENNLILFVLGFADSLREVGFADIAAGVFVLAGSVLFLVWLAYLPGSAELTGGAKKKVYMPLYFPAAAMLLWLSAVSVPASLMMHFYEGSESQMQFYQLLIIKIVDLAGIFLLLWGGSCFFARGLKGLGLRFGFGSVLRDFWAAAVNYTAIMPVIVASLETITRLGKLVKGPGYQIESHQGLVSLGQTGGWEQMMLVLSFVIVAPIFEELLFRGYFQSVIRCYTGRGWLAIAITSCVFAVIHAVPSHWPALFALSICIGYSYEKSGSLLRAMFLHGIFNGVSVTAALMAG